jgi:hypothetical protein
LEKKSLASYVVLHDWIGRQARSDLRKHASQHLEPKVLLVTETVSPALDHPDLVIQSFHEPQWHLVLLAAEGHDPVPVLLYHCRELLEGGQALPLQRGFPVVEELAGPAFPVVTPKLPEGFLQEIGLGKALIGRKQLLQRALSIQTQIGLSGQQGVLLPLDVGPLLARHAAVFAFADLVQGFSQVLHDVELIEQNGGLGAVFQGRIAEGLPHIHHSQADLAGFLLPPFLEEQVHTFLGAIHAAKPDGPLTQQIADHDSIRVAFAYRDLVHADGLRSWSACPTQLLLHVLLVHFLDLVPIQVEFLGDALDTGGATAAPDRVGKPLRIKGTVEEEGELLHFHLAATPAIDAAQLHIQVDAKPSAGEVTYASSLTVVKCLVDRAARSAGRFFSRRWSMMMRAWGSPKTPWRTGRGRKPGKRYVSSSFLERGIGKRYQIPRPPMRLVALSIKAQSAMTPLF